ncbi:MAG: hypothetical protein AAF564_00810 [Bacteroidota bacterium]
MNNWINTKTTCLLVFCMLSFAGTAFSQTVHYKTETRMKMHMLGAMGNMIGNKPQVSEVYVNDKYMLTKEGKRTSTILSAVDGNFKTMDHKKKTYFEMGFDEMANMFSTASADAEQEMGEAGYDPAAMEFSVKVEDQGNGGDVAGFSTSKKLMIMELTYTAETTNDAGNTETAAGKFYTVSEMWISKDVPGYDVVEAFGKNYTASVGQAFSGANMGRMAGMQQAFMSDGRMGPAMEQLAEEMEKLEGAPLKTVTYIVLGPEDQELDLDAIFNQKEAKKKKRRGGLGRLAKNALKNQGLNLGGEEEQPDQSEEITKQSILTETETVYLMIKTVGDDPSRFTVPSKYKKVDAPSYFNAEG